MAVFVNYLYFFNYGDPPFMFAIPLCIVGGTFLALFTNEFFTKLGPGVQKFINSSSEAGLDLFNTIAGALFACLGLRNPPPNRLGPSMTEERRD